MNKEQLLSRANDIMAEPDWACHVVMAAIVTEQALRNSDIDCDVLWSAIAGRWTMEHGL